jgi:hypothetical protein
MAGDEVTTTVGSTAGVEGAAAVAVAVAVAVGLGVLVAGTSAGVAVFLAGVPGVGLPFGAAREFCGWAIIEPQAAVNMTASRTTPTARLCLG